MKYHISITPLKMRLYHVSEWIGTALGVSGALLLALNAPASKYGWVLFLGSNLAWIAFSAIQRHRGLLVQQLVFTGTSLLGIARYF
jgi:hypothetical protein